MNRTTRTFVVVCIATLVAAGGTYGVYTAVERMPAAAPEPTGVMLAVATQALPPGTAITAEHIRFVEWPASNPLVQSGFTNAEAIVGRGLVASVVAGEPFIDAKLAPREYGAGLQSLIPAGMRAVAVRVDDVVGVAGFVAPDTHVDVLVTLRRGGPSGNEPMTRTVLSNVRVLAGGTMADPQSAPDGSTRNRSVVLSVSPADAERIALAMVEGQISLTVRNAADALPTDSKGVRVTELMRGAEPEPPPPAPRPVPVRRVAPPPPPPPPPEPEKYIVETIRGTKVSRDELE